MKNSKDDLEYEVGSSNVFADMELPNPEEHLLKARLARLINRAIEEKGWTQQHTAGVLDITPSKVSELSRGRLENISVERLLILLAQLDHRVAITISHSDRPPEEFVIGTGHRTEERQAATRG